MPSAGTFVRQWKNMADAQKYAGTMSDADYARYVAANFGTPAATGGTAAGSAPGTLPGAAPQVGTYSPPSGGVPEVPDPTKTQKDVIGGNMTNMADLYKLWDAVNQKSNEAARLQLEQNLPGYSANLAQQSANISDALAGKVSPATINNIATAAAERGITTGGGPNANAAYLRALGLTTEGLQSQGSQQLLQQIAATPKGQQFDPQSFLMTPEGQQAWQWLANIMKSAPNPAAALQNNMASALLGQAMGKSGGAGPSGTWGGNPLNVPAWAWPGSDNTTKTSSASNLIKSYMPPMAPANEPLTFGGGGATTPNAAAPTYDPSVYDPSLGVYNDPFYQDTGTPADIPQYWPEPGDTFSPTYGSPMDPYDLPGGGYIPTDEELFYLTG